MEFIAGFIVGGILCFVAGVLLTAKMSALTHCRQCGQMIDPPPPRPTPEYTSEL
jgi:gas vesicle protein